MKHFIFYLSCICLILISLSSCSKTSKETAVSNKPSELYWICENGTNNKVPSSYKRISREKAKNICDSTYFTPGNYMYAKVIDAGSPTVPYMRNAQFIMNCMFSVPLIIDCDDSDMTIGFNELITNPELLALHKNEAGNKAYLAEIIDNGVQVFVRDDGEKHGASRIVAIYNPTNSYHESVLEYRYIDLDCSSHISVRDLRARENFPEFISRDYMKCSLQPKDVLVYRITGNRRMERKTYLYDCCVDDGKYLLWPDIYSKSGGEYNLCVFVTPEGIEKYDKELDTYCCDIDLWYKTNLSYTIKVNDSMARKTAYYDPVIGYLQFKINMKKGYNSIRLEKNSYSDYIFCLSLEKMLFE